MDFVLLLGLFLIGLTFGEEQVGMVVEPIKETEARDELSDTELKLVFVIFRHGDRTPDAEELSLYDDDKKYNDIFFPFGMKALTNKGKQRSYLVGQYLRMRYDGFLSRLYLPEEIQIRTTDYARTKMSALTALAALYPPLPSQMWNSNLDWQPVPYNTVPYAQDDLMYWYNCPRYLFLRDRIYQLPEVRKWLQPYQGFFKHIAEKTGTNITTSENVFYLDNLFQALENVGLPPPTWVQKIEPKIKEMTKIEYAIELYNSELIQLATGVLMDDILNATSAMIAGDDEQPKMRLYSGHENNVAALMAAARVFEPHQPNYGATFSLELRRNRISGQYGISAVYAKDAGGPGKLLPIEGCGGQAMCDYEKFLSLTKEVVWSKSDYNKQCNNLSK